MGKKSAAQIRRLKQRAAARGEEYIHVNETSNPNEESMKDENDDKNDTDLDPELVKRKKVAKTLQDTLEKLAKDTSKNSKERRSAKRKAEAIAAEEAGCSAAELERYMENMRKEDDGNLNKENTNLDSKNEQQIQDDSSTKKKKQLPYVVFVGQLSFQTSKEDIFHHFQTQLGKDLITPETLKVRLLTDSKTKKSRGMAFVETSSPDLSYECLRLHHTTLDGRRINVERSAGGGKTSITRKEKINQSRQEQNQYLSDKVDNIIAEYKSQGNLEEGELDDGVLQLCKRHSAATVEAALAQYVEARGNNMENSSAYLTHIIGRVAIEGPDTFEHLSKNKKTKFSHNPSSKKASNDSRRENKSGRGSGGRTNNEYTTFSMQGIDDIQNVGSKTNEKEKSNRLSRIFPSMSRGRGRGRGYM